MGIRCFIVSFCAALALGCCACGSTGTPAAATGKPAGPSGNHPLGLALPAPRALLDIAAGPRRAAATPVYRRQGCDADPALPAANAVVAAQRMLFLPQWSAADPYRGGLAYALYRLNVADYHGELALTFHWRQVGDFADCFVALADFTANRWRFMPGPDGTVPIPLAQWLDATPPDGEDLYVLVVLTGRRQWELTSLEAGRPAVVIDAVGISSNWHPELPVTGWPGEELDLYARISTGWISGKQWEWRLGGGADLLRSESYGLARIRCLGSGSYPGRVTLESPAGDAEFAFTLVVRELAPPLITGIKQYVPPPGPPAASAVRAASDIHGGYQAESETLLAENAGGPYDSISWDFGPAGMPQVSAESAAQFVWAAPGVHTAHVTATNAAGSSTFAFQVTVEPQRPPALSGAQDLWCYELLPELYGLSPPWSLSATLLNTGGPVHSWDWQFGADIDPPASAVANPVATVLSAGDRLCSVTASNAAGSSTWEFSIHARELHIPEIQAVAINPDPAVAGAAVSFIPSIVSDSFGETWSWDFGGGCTPNTSDSRAPAVQALAPGSYSCSFTASNPKGSATYLFTLVVN